MPLQMPYIMMPLSESASLTEEIAHGGGVLEDGAECSSGAGLLDIDLLGGEEEVQRRITHPPAGLSPEKLKEWEDYREFTVLFQHHRERLGYMQADVVLQVGLRYGIAIAISSLAGFESARLDLEDVAQLRPTLECWMKDTARAAGVSLEEVEPLPTSAAQSRDRKRRTSITTVARGHLEMEFIRKNKPSQAEMSEMARHLGVKKDVVRIWFCNRRQRKKKRNTRADCEFDVATTTVTVPSSSHHITMEVPLEMQGRRNDSANLVAAVYVDHGGD